MHYFALLLVVVALYVPRLALVWWLPVGLFVFPITPGAATGWMVAAALVAVAAITALAATSARRGAGRPQTVTGSWANVMTPDRRDAYSSSGFMTNGAVRRPFVPPLVSYRPRRRAR